MSDKHHTPWDLHARLKAFAAELTCAAYGVALRHTAAGSWVDLELALWKVLTQAGEKWARQSPPRSEMGFVCDWTTGQPGAAEDDMAMCQTLVHPLCTGGLSDD
jgi:hypothetical protein